MTNCNGSIPQDIFLCMIYNRNEESLKKVLRVFLQELAKKYDCKDHKLLIEVLPLVGLRAMFMLLINIDPRFRYWAMQYETSTIQRPEPKKICSFLRTLRDEIVPQWMSDERTLTVDLVENAKKIYLRS